MNIRPLVGVIACRRDVEGHPAHMVTDKYVRTLRDYGLEPVVLPVWEEQRDEDVSALLARLDGLVLTGSYTNVLPERYGAQRAPENTRDDVARDAAAMSWIPLALERSLPLLGICRGFQEINVAFGGSLHQAVQRVPGMLDHREPEGHQAAAVCSRARRDDRTGRPVGGAVRRTGSQGQFTASTGRRPPG